MRLFLSFLIVPLFLASPLLAGETITIEKLPASAGEFVELRNRLAITPEGGAAIFITAMMTYAVDKELGLQCFTIALDRNNLRPSGKGYKGFAPDNGAMYHINRLDARTYLAFSYVDETKRENGYEAKAPYKITVSRQKNSELARDRVKVFIPSTGADSERPMTLNKNDKGLWKTLEWSSFSVDIRAPGEVSDDL